MQEKKEDLNIYFFEKKTTNILENWAKVIKRNDVLN